MLLLWGIVKFNFFKFESIIFIQTYEISANIISFIINYIVQVFVLTQLIQILFYLRESKQQSKNKYKEAVVIRLNESNYYYVITNHIYNYLLEIINAVIYYRPINHQSIQ